LGTHHQDETRNAVDKEVPDCKSLRGHPGFYKLLEKMGDIHSRKNGNYAKASDSLSNFRLSNELGIDPFKGCLIRMSDKWSRICQLSKGVPDLVGESLEDTLIDLANYSLISILLLREKRAKRGDNAS
jgi:hypothetical protein